MSWILESEIEELKEENKELKNCLKWMVDSYKATLWNKPVKNLDEVFSYAEKLLKKD